MFSSGLVYSVLFFSIITTYILIEALKFRQNKNLKFEKQIPKSNFSQVRFLPVFGGDLAGFIHLYRRRDTLISGMVFAIKYKEGTNIVQAIIYKKGDRVGPVALSKDVKFKTPKC